ncbi:MAG: DUF308 domain-containing protein [Muribaculaceae bacterium]|nr:DUF308 domain-containing protein [Muribaculaceae bacterium]
MNTPDQLKNVLHRIWWVPLITGLIAIALGVWCFCSPESSLATFAYVFSACLIVAGCLNISYAVANTRLHTNWGWSLVLGLLEMVCGIWLFSMPEATLAAAFAYAAGIWLLVVSINAIGEATHFSRYSSAWTILMILLLVATIFFACWFIFNPLFGGVVGWMWIGISLLFFGGWRIGLAFRILSLNRSASNR